MLGTPVRPTSPVATTTAGGRLVFHLFGALRQFEHDLIQSAPAPGWPQPRRAVEGRAQTRRPQREARARPRHHRQGQAMRSTLDARA
jgi:hypothetical protein